MSIRAAIGKVIASAHLLPQLALRPDTATFIGETMAKDIFAPSTVAKMVQTIPGSTCCLEFKGRLMQSADRMISHLDKTLPEMGEYLRKSGFEIIPVANPAEYHQMLLQLPVAADSLKAARGEIMNLLHTPMAEAVNCEITMIQAVMKQHPPDSAICKLGEEVVRQLQARKDEGLLVEQYARLSRSLCRPLEGPMYCDELRKVIFPQTLPAHLLERPEGAALKKIYDRLHEDGALDRVVWHETRHYVDDVLGMQANKLRFSEEGAFKQALIEGDLKRATSRQALPAAETSAELGSELGNYLPLEGYQSHPGIYSETFAEIGFCPEKGGAVQTGLMNGLCTDAIAYTQKRIREALEKVRIAA